MTQRLIALVAATTLGVSTVAQAGPVPLASGTVVKVSLSATPEPSSWVDPTRPAASGRSETAKATTGQVAAADPAASTPAVAPKAATETTTAPAAKPASDTAAPAKQPGYRTAKYTGGEGATWKSGRNAYGFSGTYGGCRYTGFAGPNGYKIDRSC